MFSSLFISVTAFLLLFITKTVLTDQEKASSKDLAAEQLPRFKEKTQIPIGILTTSAGPPVEYKDATHSFDQNLLRDKYFMDSVTHLDRERIPERVVHARGSGAFGYFEVTHNISHICKAKFLNKVGKKTPIAVRFSVVTGEKGGAETVRDIRGFAVKFYTEDGNLDLVALNIPSFALKDPLFFHASVHALKRNPVTNLPDPNMEWDFFTRRPETAVVVLNLFSDSGIPDGYRHLPGFPIHTFQVENDSGEAFFVRFHFLPDRGIKNLRTEEALRMDPDYATRDLYNAIESGNYPTWTVAVQILTMEDAKNAKIDVFDVTKVLPQEKYPLLKIGRFVLNKNPKNYFAEVELLAFCPANLVPGILGGPDKMFEARILSYRDTQFYRIGPNFNRVPVNCPLNEVNTYNRDGKPPVGDNGRDSPNYYPNSFNGPVPVVEKKRSKLLEIIQEKSYDIEQATDLYVNGFSEPEKFRLVQNLATSINGISSDIKQKAIKFLHMIHPDLADRVLNALETNSTCPMHADAMHY